MSKTNRWWNNKEDVHEELFSIVRYLDTEQNYRNEDDLRNLKLYGNLDVGGLSVDNYTSYKTGISERLTLNVIQNMCDTVTNKISKNKPRVSVMVNGGTGRQQKKAKQITKFIDGLIYQQNFHEKAQRAFKDSTIFGTGFVKFLIQDSEICAERVFPNEIMIDDVQAKDGCPREMHHRKYVNREVLAALYPESAEKIMACPTSGLNYKPFAKSSKDHVTLS